MLWKGLGRVGRNLVKFTLIGAGIKTPMKSHISRRQVRSKMGMTFLDLLGPVDAN